MVKQRPDYPYWRLSSFYACYFALLGGIAPYWGLYLQHLQFSPEEIGLLMASLMGTKIIAPNLWGYLADRTQKRLHIIQIGAFLTLISFAGIFVSQQFFWVMLIMILFSFFWNAILPQYEVITFHKLAHNAKFYGRIRLWGSIGFIVTVMGLGYFLDAVGIQILPFVLFGILSCIWLSSLSIDYYDVTTVDENSRESFWEILKRPEVIAFFVVCFLMQVSHGPYYTFYSIYLEKLGYSKTLIGCFWALGVLIEIIVFWSMHALMKWQSLHVIIIVSLGLAVLRWILIGEFADNLMLVLLAQCLHAATFGSFHAACIHTVQETFYHHHAGKGQALYSGLSFGAGGAVGALYSGLVWDQLGPSLSFFSAALISLLALLIAIVFLRRRILSV